MVLEAWELRKKFRFEAAHFLPHHDGKCKRLHGHSWQGEVVIIGNYLQQEGAKQGMVMDYSDLSRPVKAMVEGYLDHYLLNETLELENPTSEEVARWIYHRLIPDLPELQSVVIEETCTSRCVYFCSRGASPG